MAVRNLIVFAVSALLPVGSAQAEFKTEGPDLHLTIPRDLVKPPECRGDDCGKVIGLTNDFLIDAHGVCRFADGKDERSVFVPLKTADEYSAFRQSPATTLATCCRPTDVTIQAPKTGTEVSITLPLGRDQDAIKVESSVEHPNEICFTEVATGNKKCENHDWTEDISQRFTCANETWTGGPVEATDPPDDILYLEQVAAYLPGGQTDPYRTHPTVNRPISSTYPAGGPYWYWYGYFPKIACTKVDGLSRYTVAEMRNDLNYYNHLAPTSETYSASWCRDKMNVPADEPSINLFSDPSKSSHIQQWLDFERRYPGHTGITSVPVNVLKNEFGWDITSANRYDYDHWHYTVLLGIHMAKFIEQTRGQNLFTAHICDGKFTYQLDDPVLGRYDADETDSQVASRFSLWTDCKIVEQN